MNNITNPKAEVNKLSSTATKRGERVRLIERPVRVRLHIVRDMLAEALNLAKRGYPVFPCKPDPKSKKPLTPHGFKDATTDEEQIKKWWAKHPNAMIGMPTGRASGIDVLDIDLKPDEHVDGYRFMPNWESLSPWIAKTPSDGAHIYFKSSGAVTCSASDIAPGIDTKGEGGYVIVPPSHNAKGKYRFIKREGDLEDLPEFPAELLAKLKQPHAGHAGDKQEADPKLVAAALEVIPNPASLAYADWKTIGMATWGATRGSEEGFAAFDAWSRKWVGYDEANTRKAWEQLTKSPPTRIGAGTLFYHARQADPNWCDNVPGSLVLSPEAPVDSGLKFLERKHSDGLIYYRGTFYEWSGTHYTEMHLEMLRSKLYEFLDKASIVRKGALLPFNPTRSKVDLVVDALKGLIIEDPKKDAPFWMGSDAPPAELREVGNLIAVSNGVLDIETRERHPHNPRLFNVTCLPFDYDPKAPKPRRWLRFLREVWPLESDVEAENTLQEFFGLALTGDTSYQKILLITGPKRSGKGTICRVLIALLGKANAAGPTLSSLGERFGLEPLIDKRVAIISDAQLSRRATSHTVAERLLSLTGEDLLNVQRKNKSDWIGQLGVRFLICSNELPHIRDASAALVSRYVPLVMRESFYGREDLTLVNTLMTELPGIVNWALEGLDRLRKRGYFVIPEASRDAARQLESLASPAGAFVPDWCEPGSDKKHNCASLYKAYCRWCDVEGHHAESHVVFGRDLNAVLPHLRTRGHTPNRYYIGIDLSEAGRAALEKASWG